MATIEKAKTLLKRIILSNLVSKNDLYMTPQLNGPHGIGKTQIAKRAAKELDGKCFVIEGGLLREGEIGGLPFATQGQNGTTEVRFVKYYVINQLYQLQKFYYEKLEHEGFLNGKIKITTDENGKKYFHDFDKKYEMESEAERIINGEENKYNIDKYISADTRLKLIETGEIFPVIVLIDEINRTDQMTQREIMNILLNHRVNGFDLPWFAQFVGACNPSSQNSSYATNEFDPAQISRMCNIKVKANIADWIDHALENHFNNDVVEALAMAEGIFTQKDSSFEDETQMFPDPRAWEMIAHFYDTAKLLNETKFFDSDERSELQSDMRAIISGKVGDTAARTLIETINRKENNIKPAEIITGKDKKIAPAVLDKFKSQKSLSRWIIANNVMNYFYNNWEDFKKKKASKDEKIHKEGENLYAQFGQFINELDVSTQVCLLKNLSKLGSNARFYVDVSTCFSTGVLAQLGATKKGIQDLTSDN